MVAGSVFDRIDIYLVAENTWVLSDTKMALPRHGIFPVLVGDDIFIAGGGEKRGFAVSS